MQNSSPTPPRALNQGAGLPLLIVAGPTGSGKTALSIRLAQECGGEIINYDSVQFFQEFTIATAKPSEQELRQAVHHGIDMLPPDELFTAGHFIRWATAQLADVTGRGKVPILCGGTGFYVRSLLRGLSPSPERDDALRQRLLQREEKRPGALHKLLRRLDAPAGERIHASDRNKTVRALELRLLSGLPSQELFSEGLPALQGYRPLWIGLQPPRETLCTKLDLRCKLMWQQGLVEETRALLQRYPRTCKAFTSLGYRQALQVLDGELPEAAALQEMQARTRQYAKRQVTWFRAEPGMNWHKGFGDDDAIQEEVLRAVRNFFA